MMYHDLKALIGELQESASSSREELLSALDLTGDQEQTLGQYDSYLYRLSRDRITLQRALAHVENEECRAQLARRRTLNKNVGINQLPDEVLAEILLLSTASHENVWSSPELKTCHHWRQIAERAPRIWSRLHVTREIPPECINLWITRSASVPLHLHFAIPPLHSGRSFQPLWRRIMQHSRRLQSLFLGLEESWWIGCVLPITYRVDNLRDLQISLDVEFPSHNNTSVDIFEPPITPPQLQTLAITADSDPGDISMPALPHKGLEMPSLAASSIVELAVGHQVAPEAVCRFLRECKGIRRLFWDLRSYPSHTSWTPSPTYIPTLERLHIAGSLAAKFIRIADLPALRRLVVLNTNNNPNVYKAILGFPKITHLRMDFRQIDKQDVRSIFESLRHLEHLSYHWGGNTFKAILALVEWKERGGSLTWHCPHMKQLHLAVGDAISHGLRPTTVRSCLEKVMRIRARSVEAPLDVILDDSRQTAQFADLGVRRVPLASFPTV